MLGDKTTRKRPGSALPRDPDAVTPEATDRGASDGPVYASSQLFGSHKQITIEHNGGRYVLRITRLGKLVLNK